MGLKRQIQLHEVIKNGKKETKKKKQQQQKKKQKQKKKKTKKKTIVETIGASLLFPFPRKIGFDETICMKCQSLICVKIKKNAVKRKYPSYKALNLPFCKKNAYIHFTLNTKIAKPLTIDLL